VSEVKQEFLKRSITAICLSAVVIALVLFSSNLILNIFIFLLSLALFFEWMKVSESSFKKKVIFLLLFTFLIVCILGIGTLFEPIPFITMLGITIWIVVAYQIFFKEGRLSSNFSFTNFWIGLILISTFCLTCFQFVNGSRLFLLIVIFNVAVFDSGAYIIGKNFGKNSFLPELSPNKTIEGLIGGLTSSIFFVTFLCILLEEVSLRASVALMLSIPFALCGDYFFSFLKRKANIKDTGSILPGHGGLLDRVDSHLAAIPMTSFFSLLLYTIGSYF
jgi:phosphatidate cytidylyltransferase